MDRETRRENTTARGDEEEEMKMELELDAAHALANLAGSGPVSNHSSDSQVILHVFFFFFFLAFLERNINS
jgi:hypothetical protein